MTQFKMINQLLLVGFLLALLLGCGQTGPLYLPEECDMPSKTCNLS